MRPRHFASIGFHGLLAAILMAATFVLLSSATLSDTKLPFKVAGTYVEGCSCHAPCPCEMVGLNMSCEGVGAMSLSSGRYKGTSLAGAKIAYATAPGEWVQLYVDARNARQKKAAAAFATALFKSWGNVEKVEYAPINFSGGGGWYKVAVNGGKTLQLTTQPVLGRDKKEPIAHTNVTNTLTNTFLQGKTVAGSFKSGNHDFKLKGGNSYFYPVQRSGRI